MSSSRCVAAHDAAASASWAPETMSSPPPSAPPMPPEQYQDECEFVVVVVDLELGHHHQHSPSTELPLSSSSSGVHGEEGDEFTDVELGLGHQLERRTSTVVELPPSALIKRPSDHNLEEHDDDDSLGCKAAIVMLAILLGVLALRLVILIVALVRVAQG